MRPSIQLPCSASTCGCQSGPVFSPQKPTVVELPALTVEFQNKGVTVYCEPPSGVKLALKLLFIVD